MKFTVLAENKEILTQEDIEKIKEDIEWRKNELKGYKYILITVSLQEKSKKYTYLRGGLLGVYANYYKSKPKGKYKKVMTIEV